MLYADGFATYDDIARRHHWMRFCVRWDPKNGMYSDCSVGNEIDDFGPAQNTPTPWPGRQEKANALVSWLFVFSAEKKTPREAQERASRLASIEKPQNQQSTRPALNDLDDSILNGNL